MFAAKKTDQVSAAGIQYVGGTSGSFTVEAASTSTTISLTSLTGGIASAPSIGDLIVVTTGLGGVNDYPIFSTGKTLLTNYANSNADNLINIWAKYALLDEDLTLVRFINDGATSTNRHYCTTVHVYRGATGYFVPASVLTSASSLTTAIPNPPSITPTVAGSIIHVAGSAGHQRGQQNFTASYLSGFISIGGPDLQHDTTTGAGYVTWTSGAYDPAAWTFSGVDATSYANNSASLAIAPKTAVTTPTWVGGTRAISAGSATIVINKPSGVVQNDLMVAIVTANDTGAAKTFTGPTGWTEAGEFGGLAVYYKTAGASEGSNYTFTCSAVQTISGIIMAFRNAAWDLIGTSATGLTPTLPSITLSSNNSTVIAFVRSGGNQDFGMNITDNSYTYVYKDVASLDTHTTVIAIKEGVASGSTGTVTSTTNKNSSAEGFLIGIKPA